MLLGAHVPVTGGLPRAPGNGQAIGAEAIQVFTRSHLQWKCKPLGEGECAEFRAALAGSGVRSVMSHGSYLLNLATPDPLLLEKSRQGLLQELQRCEGLGIPYAVFHPGAHLGSGVETGLERVAAGLDFVLERTSAEVMPLLEVTAGQGSCLGHNFEQLAGIFARLRDPERVGVCLDTCHLYAAGYDIATAKGYEDTFAAFDQVVGLRRLKALHLNDAKQPLGSRLDRHARPGEGHVGLGTFRRLVNDPRLSGLPAVVETPGPIESWREQVGLLRGLVRPLRGPRARPRKARAG